MKKLAYIPLYILLSPFILLVLLFKVTMFFAALLDTDFEKS